MKVAILGGSGFIGLNLCQEISLHEDVISLDNKEVCSVGSNIERIRGDYYNIETLKDIVSKSDVIIHSLSLLTPSNSNEKYMEGYKLEIPQMVKLCELVKEYKKRLIFISSGGTVYGDRYSEPVKEYYATNPINHYGAVKVCLEEVIRTFIRQEDIDATIARVSNPYGRGQDYSKGVGFIDAVVKNGISGKVIDVWGDGDNIRDYIYIDDVCKMLYALCKEDKLRDIYNISTGIGTTQNQIIAYVSHVLGPLKVQYSKRRSVDARMSILNNERIKEIYSEQLMEIHRGIKLYIEYIKENNVLVEEA